jgi:hypothetical protein
MSVDQCRLVFLTKPWGSVAPGVDGVGVGQQQGRSSNFLSPLPSPLFTIHYPLFTDYLTIAERLALWNK